MEKEELDQLKKEQREEKKRQEEAKKERSNETYHRAKKFLREYFDRLAREQKEEVQVSNRS